MARIAALLPVNTRGRKRLDAYGGSGIDPGDQFPAERVLSEIAHVIRSGGRWADAPGVLARTETDDYKTAGLSF